MSENRRKLPLSAGRLGWTCCLPLFRLMAQNSHRLVASWNQADDSFRRTAAVGESARSPQIQTVTTSAFTSFGTVTITS